MILPLKEMWSFRFIIFAVSLIGSSFSKPWDSGLKYREFYGKLTESVAEYDQIYNNENSTINQINNRLHEWAQKYGVLDAYNKSLADSVAVWERPQPRVYSGIYNLPHVLELFEAITNNTNQTIEAQREAVANLQRIAEYEYRILVVTAEHVNYTVLAVKFNLYKNDTEYDNYTFLDYSSSEGKLDYFKIQDQTNLTIYQIKNETLEWAQKYGVLEYYNNYQANETASQNQSLQKMKSVIIMLPSVHEYLKSIGNNNQQTIKSQKEAVANFRKSAPVEYLVLEDMYLEAHYGINGTEDNNQDT